MNHIWNQHIWTFNSIYIAFMKIRELFEKVKSSDNLIQNVAEMLLSYFFFPMLTNSSELQPVIKFVEH